MVDPRIYENPYRPPNPDAISRDTHKRNLQDMQLIPKGTIPEVMPSDGRIVKLVACLKCTQLKVPYVYTPRTRVWESTCQACGQRHVFHPRGFDFKTVQGDRRVESIGATRIHKGKPYIDATKGFEELRRKRELGRAYWRNPK